jgi:hypothetical protein
MPLPLASLSRLDVLVDSPRGGVVLVACASASSTIRCATSLVANRSLVDPDLCW